MRVRASEAKEIESRKGDGERTIRDNKKEKKAERHEQGDKQKKRKNSILQPRHTQPDAESKSETAWQLKLARLRRANTDRNREHQGQQTNYTDAERHT